MAVQLQELIQAGIYPDAESAVQETRRVLWQERPQVRIDVAVHRYRTEELSVAKAVAGVSFDRMKEILVAHGVALRLGLETLQEARAEVAALKRMRP